MVKTKQGVSATVPFRDPALTHKLGEAKKEKQAIAARAYSLIEDQQTLYLAVLPLNSGSCGSPGEALRD